MSIRERFKGAGGGFGITSYYNARMAGYSPQEIQEDLERSSRGVGYRARDLIAQDLARESGYQQKISGYDSQLSDYQNQVKSLTSQYSDALSEAQQNAAARDEYESKFKDATSQFEAAQDEARRYREEAVGQQLRAVRSGSTAGGGNQTSQLRGSLASGRTGYSSDDGTISDLAESMKSQGGLTDSVLSREGPVVQQLAGGSGRPTGGSQRKVISSAGTGSYYASRFR